MTFLIETWIVGGREKNVGEMEIKGSSLVSSFSTLFVPVLLLSLSLLAFDYSLVHECRDSCLLSRSTATWSRGNNQSRIPEESACRPTPPRRLPRPSRFSRGLPTIRKTCIPLILQGQWLVGRRRREKKTTLDPVLTQFSALKGPPLFTSLRAVYRLRA